MDAVGQVQVVVSMAHANAVMHAASPPEYDHLAAPTISKRCRAARVWSRPPGSQRIPGMGR